MHSGGLEGMVYMVEDDTCFVLWSHQTGGNYKSSDLKVIDHVRIGDIVVRGMVPNVIQ